MRLSRVGISIKNQFLIGVNITLEINTERNIKAMIVEKQLVRVHCKLVLSTNCFFRKI